MLSVYCAYPGTIDNGQVLLVGAIGKYEYRPYVEGIGQNEQIEFMCAKNYKRVGHQVSVTIVTISARGPSSVPPLKGLSNDYKFSCRKLKTSLHRLCSSICLY